MVTVVLRGVLIYLIVQWAIDTLSPVERKEVKQKSLKALESLGHKDLSLDEYESAC